MLLDKYTSLGVYVIHHSFTLAELFALSGLQLVSSTLTAGIRVNSFLISIPSSTLPPQFFLNFETIFLLHIPYFSELSTCPRFRLYFALLAIHLSVCHSGYQYVNSVEY